MNPLVLLRASSGSGVGTGHVRRSRSIASALLDLGARVLFIVDEKASAKTLRGEGHDVRLSTEGGDWTDLGATAAWLDGYGDFSPELLRLSKAHTRSVLVENRTSARHFADLVLYPALHWTPDAWDHEHKGRVLGGAEWIPLAPEIRRTRERERDTDLLVTFGGSDPGCLTERVLEALDPTLVRSIAVTIGWHMDARRASIEKLVQPFEQATVLPTGAPLGAWMARSHRAVTALGTTLYELAYLRTPACVLANYESDREALAFYGAHGPHHPIGVAAEVDRGALVDALHEHLKREFSLPPVVGLGGGAARLALVLLGRRLFRQGAA